MSYLFRTIKSSVAVLIILSVTFSPLTSRAQSFGDLLGTAAKTVVQCTDIVGIGLSALTSAATGIADSIYPGLGKLFGAATGEGGDAVPISNKIIQDSTKALKSKESCADAAAYELAKSVIAKITQDNLKWLTTSNNGNPLYILNQKNYFSELRNKEVEKIITKIVNDSGLPYGKQVSQGLIKEYKSFDQKIQPTIDKATSEAFQEDFSSGGWETFTKFAEPQNNVFGSYILTREHIAKETRKKEEDTKNELSWNGGVLSKKENDCDTSDADCAVETPGSIILDQIKLSLGTPIRQLEQADEISEVLSKLFEKLTGQLTTKGLGKVSTGTGYSSGETAWFNEDNGVNHSNDSIDVDLRTDLSKIIKDQESFIEKVNTETTILRSLVKKAYELDFCVPGPRPGWAEEASSSLQSALNNMHIFDASSGAVAIGFVTGLEVDANKKVENRDLVTKIISLVFTQYKNLIDARYDKTPSSSSVGLPSVARSAEAEYRKIASYNEVINENIQKITATQDIIVRLNKIQENISKPGISEEDYQKQYSLFKLLAPQIANEENLRDEDAAIELLKSSENNTDISIELCIEETTDKDYGRPTNRLEYPFPIDKHGLSTSSTFINGEEIDVKGQNGNENILVDGDCPGDEPCAKKFSDRFEVFMKPYIY